MICPSCGKDVMDARFCENCGSPLPSSVGPASSDFASQPAFGQTAQMPQQPQPQQVPQPTAQMPQQPQMPQPVGAQPSPAYPQGFPSPAPTQAPLAPNAAFVMAIVGLVLSLMFVTCLPGIVCSVIGLVLNAGYNKKGLANPRKTPTTVLGVIGVIAGALGLVMWILFGIGVVVAVDEYEHGAASAVVVSPQSTSNSPSASAAAANPSSGSAASSASSASSSSAAQDASASAASPAAGSSSQDAPAASSAASSTKAYADSRYHDAKGNPSLFSMLELSGAELQALLEEYGYKWDSSGGAWSASSGSMFGVQGVSGSLDKTQINTLPKGGIGQPVVYASMVPGYDTPAEAFDASIGDVVVEDRREAKGLVFAVVHGPSMGRSLAVGTVGDGKPILMVFSEESIESGLFTQLIGMSAGSTLDEVWQTITLSADARN